jgi:6-phosphogluconolactonase
VTPTDDQQPAHPAPRIEVHVDAADLATAVAGELIARLEAAQARGEEPQIGLTGGSIAVAVHEELARRGAGSEVDWSRVVLWWGDERFVAAESDDRNARQAMSAFGDRLAFDPAKVHEVPSTAEASSVDDAAAAYSAQLREHGAGSFEVLMLGVGPDGHVASLFPGSPQLDADDQVAVGVTGSPKPPPERVSLTFAALNRSRSVWFLVSGEEKADAVARALAPGTDPHEIPAAGVTGELETIWFLDRASASEL